MPDEWACDECGYIAGSEPDGEKCPGCGSKMTKIEGDDFVKDDDTYDEEDLAKADDEDWDDIEIEPVIDTDEEEKPEKSKKN